MKVDLQHDRLPDEGFELDDPENDDDIVIVMMMMIIMIMMIKKKICYFHAIDPPTVILK
jgi:hypothetical protein